MQHLPGFREYDWGYDPEGLFPEEMARLETHYKKTPSLGWLEVRAVVGEMLAYADSQDIDEVTEEFYRILEGVLY